MRVFQLKGITIGMTVVFAMSASVAFAQESPSLVHQYAALRGVLYTAEIGQAANRLGELDDKQVDGIAAALAKTMSKSKSWNADSPDWSRVVAVISGDLRKTVGESKNDPQWAQFKKAYQDTFELGLARSLTSEELQQLIGFYGSPAGRRYREAYDQMTKVVSLGMFDLKIMAGKGERLSEIPAAERTEYAQLISLFKEETFTQWAIFDPGPGKDRSGLQAIPIMFAAAVQLRLSELSRTWHQLGDGERRSILAFRESDLGKRELQAASESARGLHGLFNEFGEPKGLGMIERLQPFQQKWQAMIQN